MFEFFANHWGSMLAGGIVLIAVILVIVKMVKDRCAGKSSCGCGSGCSGCANSGCSSWPGDKS
ncbi:MAG: FeoB-associated Cys-rich membrane protein [Anaerovoracaceae bacterium]